MADEVEPLGAEQLLGPLVVERCPLEVEEEQRGLDLRPALAHALEQRAARGLLRVSREPQHRVRAGAARELLDLGERALRRDEALAVELADPPLVLLGEDARPPGGQVEQALDARLALAVDERVEVPGDVPGVAGHPRRLGRRGQGAYLRFVDSICGRSSRRSMCSTCGATTRRRGDPFRSPRTESATASAETRSRGTVRARWSVRRRALDAGRRSQLNHSALRRPTRRRASAAAPARRGGSWWATTSSR